MIPHMLSFINSNSEISSQLSCFLVVILTIVNLDDNNQPALVYLILIGFCRSVLWDHIRTNHKNVII